MVYLALIITAAFFLILVAMNNWHREKALEEIENDPLLDDKEKRLLTYQHRQAKLQNELRQQGIVYLCIVAIILAAFVQSRIG